MNKMKLLSFLSAVFFLSSCSCERTTKVVKDDKAKKTDIDAPHIIDTPPLEEDKTYLKYYENEKYVIGKRVSDLFSSQFAFEPNQTLTFDELPDVDIKTDSRGYLDITFDDEKVHDPGGFYIADFNQDGYFDMCFTYSTNNSSPIYYLKVYDLQRGEYIYELKDSYYSYFFGLDEINILCITTSRAVTMIRSPINNSKLLKEGENRLEESPITCRLDGFFLENANKTINASEAFTCRIYYMGFITDDTEFPIKTNDIIIEKVSGSEFVYSIDYKDTGTFNISILLTSSQDTVLKIDDGRFSEIVTITIK